VGELKKEREEAGGRVFECRRWVKTKGKKEGTRNNLLKRKGGSDGRFSHWLRENIMPRKENGIVIGTNSITLLEKGSQKTSAKISRSCKKV